MSKKTTIGGQALIEGILMRGPDKTCIAVRRPDGGIEIKQEEGGTQSRRGVAKIPLLRGVLGFWDTMKYGVKAINYSADVSMAEEGLEKSKFEEKMEAKYGADKMNKFFSGVALVLGILIPIGLFILLPTFVAGFFKSEINTILKNLIEGVIRISIFILFLFATSRQKDVKRTYMYHGAEHKSIHCYENEQPLDVEHVRQSSRFHPRCGTSFLFVVLIISILVYSLFTWSNPVMRMVIRLALLPVIVGVSYEINRFVGRYDNLLSRILRAPGLFLQRFTTFEPDDDMMEVALEALAHVIPENKDSDNW